MSDTRRTVQRHPIAPVWDETSRILILGSFPSVKSREAEFFYGHPQNRFWRVLAGVFSAPVPETVEQKKKLVLENRLALWDVIAECEIIGSADTSIKNVKPNDIAGIIEKTAVSRIFVNGKTAEKYYIRYIEKTVGQKAVCLPSTSPANAAWSLDRLINAWQIIK